MTDADDSTMAANEAAGTAFKKAEPRNKSKRLKPTPVARNPVQRTHKYTMRVYFPMPRATTKFNPISSMRLFFKEMLKYDSTITVTSMIDDQQIQLAIDAVPALEGEFKKFFVVTNDTRPTGTPPHVIIGCNMMSEQTVREIKFDSTQMTPFMDWLKKEKIFLESDSLGITKTMTVGYLTKLHSKITNRTFLKPLLNDFLSDVILPPELACNLDPSLKQQYETAKANGDFFVPAPPPFEIFKTHISYGRDDKKIKTDVIGIKCAVEKGQLLKEFFTQMSNPMDLDTRIGTFIPSGTVHLIGTDAYAKLLCDNNLFLQNIATVPIGDFQHATLDIPYSTDNSTDIDAITLEDTILAQPWCLSLEKSTTANKVIIVTTKGQLEAARAWTDNILPDLYSQHISDKIDVTTLQKLIPRRLDKPVITAASANYAKQLQHRTSIVTATPTKQNQLNRPPRSRIVKPADITYAEATKQQETRQTCTELTATAATTNLPQVVNQPEPFDYQATLDRITKDVETTLKAKFDAAINNLQKSFANLEERVDKKIQHHMEILKSSQADKDTQVTHTKRLEQMSKTLDYLVERIHLLLDSEQYPTPMRGVGRS